ncbi:MAG: DUF3168 domain-containing protein [Rhizobiaceae bacterium]|nr:DUF3168 domain-containing protein [Rhizobiaceae bacterium]
MSHPGLEVQGVIYTSLAANAQLATLIGPGRIYDDVPPNQHPPYVTFGRSNHLDWSTDSESGMEHEFELHSWTRENGRKEIYLIQEVLIEVLTGLIGAMDEHHIINFTHENSAIETHDKYQAFLGISTFRVITEPIA